VHHSADADPAGLGKRFEACGDINAVTKDVATIADDVTEVDPDAELDPPILSAFSAASVPSSSAPISRE